VLACAFAFFACVFSGRAAESSAASERAALVAKLETVNRRLGRFEHSKDRIFLEQHMSEIRQLRDERERLQSQIDAIDAPSVETRHDLLPIAPTVAAQIAVTSTPAWVRGGSVGYAETCVTAVLGSDKPAYWLVRREFDSEGRLEKVIPVCEIEIQLKAE